MGISQAWQSAQDEHLAFIGEDLGSVPGMTMEKKSGQTTCKWRLFWMQRFLWGSGNLRWLFPWRRKMNEVLGENAMEGDRYRGEKQFWEY